MGEGEGGPAFEGVERPTMRKERDETREGEGTKERSGKGRRVGGRRLGGRKGRKRAVGTRRRRAIEGKAGEIKRSLLDNVGKDSVGVSKERMKVEIYALPVSGKKEQKMRELMGGKRLIIRLATRFGWLFLAIGRSDEVQSLDRASCDISRR